MENCPGQWSFFDPPAQRHSSESLEAAAEIANAAPNLRARVLAAIEELGPLTDEQIARVTGIAPNTARPRRVELVDAGLVAKVGVSRTQSGRKAAAWGLVA